MTTSSVQLGLLIGRLTTERDDLSQSLERLLAALDGDLADVDYARRRAVTALNSLKERP